MSSPLLRRAVALALFTALPLAAAPVSPFSATYEVRRNGDVLGEATLQLAATGSEWQLTTQTRGTRGLAAAAGVRINESSRFRYLAGAPETIEYRYVQRTSFNSRERGAVVDANGGRVALRNRSDRHDVPYVRGVLDRQLVTVALMQAVAAGRSGVQTLQVADRHEIEAQTWVIGGAENVPMGADTERGLRVERRRDPSEGRHTVLWLDQDQGHLPLRIEQREDDGERVEMRLLRRG